MNKIIATIRKDKKKGVMLLVALMLVIVGIISMATGSSDGPGTTDNNKIEAIPLPNLDDTSEFSDSKSDIYALDMSQEQKDSLEKLKFESENDYFFGVEKDEKQVPNDNLNGGREFDNIFGEDEQNNSNVVKSNHNNISDENVIIVDQSQIKRTRIPSDGYGTMGGASTVKDGSNVLIKAVISNNNKAVKTGSTIRIRITEACTVGSQKIAANTIISGICTFTRERVKIAVTSINIAGNIIACQYTIYEIDGIEGVYVPGGINIEILKDGTDEAITESGTKINTPIGSFSTDALKRKNQDPSILIRDGHKVYLKLLE